MYTICWCNSVCFEEHILSKYLKIFMIYYLIDPGQYFTAPALSFDWTLKFSYLKQHSHASYIIQYYYLHVSTLLNTPRQYRIYRKIYRWNIFHLPSCYHL